ncbi:hypothetical protein WDZ16_01380 [Pseudokineococcus marinus]|uniref:DUF4352 domain-containing protein n=1 Tax=Pseudokineococcus marinus TaxID=351215 RepID=A0A849BL23_9ACTN|nr:hypothetical protein [Pseudokineococcus marinus]NNH21502.1 hypothetical protein [Pseudokineococcus marinus]
MRRTAPVLVRAAAVAVLAPTVLGLTGCGLLSRDAEGGGTSSAAQEQGSGGSEVSSSGGESVVGEVAADVQDRHPQGHLLTASAVQVRDRSIAVEIALVNGSTREIQMNSNRLHLLDDVGNAYEFSPPTQNEDLRVAPGAELSGTLVFLGVLDPSATSLTMLANVNDPEQAVDLEDRDNQGSYPELVLDGLPLP